MFPFAYTTIYFSVITKEAMYLLMQLIWLGQPCLILTCPLLLVWLAWPDLLLRRLATRQMLP